LSEVVRLQDADVCRRWQAPDVDPPKEEQPVTELLTAERVAELEAAVRAEAWEKGYQEGLAAGAAEIRERGRRLAAIVDALAEPLADLDETVEAELVALARALARQVVRRQFQLQPDEIVPVVREAVAALPAGDRTVEIRLHPEDRALVTEALSLDEQGTGWTLRDDPELSRGDCRVRAEHSEVDARLETRMATIFAAVLGDRRGEGGA
jgi:flagellar assembly protein FliH